MTSKQKIPCRILEIYITMANKGYIDYTLSTFDRFKVSGKKKHVPGVVHLQGVAIKSIGLIVEIRFWREFARYTLPYSC